MNGESRRAFLTGSGAVTLAALAGCVDDLTDFDGDEGPDGDDEPSLPAFHQWLYAPDEVGLGAYAYTSLEGDALSRRPDFSSALGSHGLRGIETTIFEGSMTRPTEPEAGVSIEYPDDGRATYGLALTGEYDPDDISDLEAEAESNEVDTTEHDGFDVYWTPTFAVAVETVSNDGSSRTVVTASADAEADASAYDVVEAMIDARSGSRSRLAETDAAVDAVLREQGDRPFVFGGPTTNDDVESLFDADERDETLDIEAGGISFGSDDESSYRVTLVTDEPVSDADALEAELPAVDSIPNPAVSIDDTVVTVEYGDEDDAAESDEPPQASFDVEFDLDRNEMTIRHLGGDPIPADELRFKTSGGVNEPVDSYSDSNVDVVEPGDRFTLPVTSSDVGGQFELVWEPDSTVLFSDRIPEPERNDEPQAQFGINFPNDDVAVLFHETGDEIAADELIVHTTGGVMESWQALSGDAVVSAGDAIEVQHGDPGGDIGLEWAPESTFLLTESIPDRESDVVPQASFDAQFDEASREIDLYHAGGDEISATELDIYVDSSEPREYRWDELSNDRDVERGDSVSLPYYEGDHGGVIYVVWVSESELLDEIRIPDDH